MYKRQPQTRSGVNERGLNDSADRYLEKIYPPLLPGFRRTPGTWKLSEDKCRGDFSITDEEMPPVAPPQKIIEVSAEHSYQANDIARWTGTISATYDVDRGSGKAADAVAAFVGLVKDRWADAQNMQKGGGLNFGGLNAGVRPGERVTLIPIKASAAFPLPRSTS